MKSGVLLWRLRPKYTVFSLFPLVFLCSAGLFWLVLSKTAWFDACRRNGGLLACLALDRTLVFDINFL